MKAIINGRLILKSRLLDGKALVFDEKITGFCNAGELPAGIDVVDAAGAYVSPGLIDVHTHGCLGYDASDGNPGQLREMCAYLPKTGVTAWLPTTMTIPPVDIVKAFDAIRSVKKESPTGARILGVNMEGPYLNKKRKGAHLEENLLPPDAKFIKENADIMRLVTIAPELDDNFAAVKAACGAGVVVSIGHSDADYSTAMHSFANGVKHTTHLFNAMSPLNHRDPGVVGAALDADVTVELITDTFHIHKDVFKLVHKLKGDKLILITDSIRSAGMPDGEYDLGGQQVVLKGIECRLLDGTIAGSVLTMIGAVKNMNLHTSVPLFEIVACASLYPARVIGFDKTKGSLEVGKDADITIFDDTFNVQKTIIGGDIIYGA